MDRIEKILNMAWFVWQRTGDPEFHWDLAYYPIKDYLE